MTTGRLEAFSDGVFAVAITLLVLDIHPPTDARGGSDLWRRLGDLWPHYAAYVVSFLVIGIVWVNHHAVLELIREVDRRFAFLNLLLLMSIALIPFATALLADYLSTGGGPGHTAAAAYSAVISLTGVAFLSAGVCLGMHALLAVYYALSRRGGGMARPAGLA